jgi:hypothetical protein
VLKSFKKFYLTEMPTMFDLESSPDQQFDLQVEIFCARIIDDKVIREPNYNGFKKYMDTIFRAETPIKSKWNSSIYLNTKKKKKQFWIHATKLPKDLGMRTADIDGKYFDVHISWKKGIIKRKDTGEILFDLKKYLELPDTKELTDEEINSLAEYELKKNLDYYEIDPTSTPM